MMMLIAVIIAAAAIVLTAVVWIKFGATAARNLIPGLIVYALAVAALYFAVMWFVHERFRN